MKTIIATIIATIAFAAVAFAYPGDLTKEEIARLPQDRVAAIQKMCERRYQGESNYSSQVVCENREYRALKELIQRGSFPNK
jgi:hypothetical protein